MYARVRLLSPDLKGSPPGIGASLPDAGVTLRGRVPAADRDQFRGAAPAVDVGERHEIQNKSATYDGQAVKLLS